MRDDIRRRRNNNIYNSVMIEMISNCTRGDTAHDRQCLSDPMALLLSRGTHAAYDEESVSCTLTHKRRCQGSAQTGA